jgi:hypothetical protein
VTFGISQAMVLCLAGIEIRSETSFWPPPSPASCPISSVAVGVRRASAYFPIEIASRPQAFAHHLYASNVAAFCERHLNGWTGPALGVNAPVEPGGSLWCDAFLRVPDHFAGTVSAWNIEQNTIAGALKYQQVLRDGIASHPNVHVMRVLFKCENDLISAFSQSLAVTRR